MFNSKKTSKAKGFTLIEILLVVGFIALAGIGIYVVYDKMQQSYLVTSEVKNLDMMVATMHEFYYFAPSSIFVSQPVLINSKVIPDHMVDRTQNPAIVKSGFGQITFTNMVSSVGTLAGFNYTNIPSNVCSKFVIAASRDAYRVVVDNTVVKNVLSEGRELLDIQRTTQLCSDNANVNLFFKVKR